MVISLYRCFSNTEFFCKSETESGRLLHCFKVTNTSHVSSTMTSNGYTNGTADADDGVPKSTATWPHFGTDATHHGSDPDTWNFAPIVPPISLSTTFKQNSPGVYEVIYSTLPFVCKTYLPFLSHCTFCDPFVLTHCSTHSLIH